MSKKRKSRSIQTFRALNRALKPRAMFTLNVHSLEYPKDEAQFALRLRDRFRYALRATEIAFLQKREFSREGLLHYHIGVSRDCPPEIVAKIKASCLRLLGKPNNRGTPIHYGACRSPDEQESLQDYLAKEFDTRESPAVSVIVPPSRFPQSGWKRFYHSHRLRPVRSKGILLDKWGFNRRKERS